MPNYSFETEFLFDSEGELTVPEVIGPVPEGVRMNFYVKGGKFEGPKLRGKTRAVGGDWFLLRPDGVGQLDVRATMETDDGALIYVYYSGLIDFPEEVKQALARGEQPAGEFKIFTNPIFRTSSEKYAWLNSTFAVGVGASAGENKISYTVYRLK